MILGLEMLYKCLRVAKRKDWEFKIIYIYYELKSINFQLIIRTFFEDRVRRLEGCAMEETSHGYGHNVGGVPGGDANDILVVQTAAFQVLGDANGPGESLTVGDFHALGVRNLWIH